jgi:manganese/zinc/iron transport system ATP- binding protein
MSMLWKRSGLMSDQIVLDVEQLTVNYDKTPVLWNVSFSVPKGKLAAIIGPNGAGKSTLVKTVLGLLQPLTGKVSFFGQPFKKVRDKIAYVPQRTSVDWDFPVTVLDVVLMGRYGRLGLFHRPRKADKEAARKALDMVGMLAFENRQISQLSGGQQQRIFIARALLQEAEVYFLDEPFAGVDMATEKAIVLLLDLLKTEGKTVFIVHHDLNTVDQYFDWVVMLNTCLIANGPVAEVFHKEAILRTYGSHIALLDTAAKLSQNKMTGKG